MVKKIKIFIQKPWKISDSPYYKTLREFPPKGVEYANIKEFNLIQSKSKMKFSHVLKDIIKRIIRKIYPSMPNAHFTPNAKDYDLIHCAHCLSKNKHPWICNLEYIGQFWAAPKGYGDYSSKKQIKKYLNSPYCKKIVAWTNWVKKDILREFPEVKYKTTVVYPGIPPQKNINRKSRKKIRLLFASRRFYFKGGLFAVEVMDRLTKKYSNVKAMVVSDVPNEIICKYSKNKKIKFVGMIPQKELFEKIYPSADIFVYPSFTDTFGFPITEAMSFGLPVVSVRGYSRDEIIENGKTGFVIPSPFTEVITWDQLKNLHEKTVKDLCIKISKIIENTALREKMSKECIKLFINKGKFSIETRNKNLEKIYLEAIS